MTDFLDRLTGGYYQNKRKQDEERLKNTYSVFMQFDDDKPILMHDNIDNENKVIFEVHVDKEKDQNTFIEFKCKNTGKIFKVFTK